MSLPAPLPYAPQLLESHSRAISEAPRRELVRADRLTGKLKRKYGSRITGHSVQPAREGRYAELPADLPGPIADALRARGIEHLYSHQAEAWQRAQAGGNFVVVTPTASGKTLCYTLPVLAGAIESRAKALYLFPTKALAQDQLAELLELNRAGDLGIKAHTFDGDTPGDARQAIRLHGDLVISNPDMLHQAILPHHTKWAQFFENLRYVVIDEIHSYRGVFGAHLANVLRRLQRICAFYGSKPQFILASATIGNPAEHASALIGARVEAITESGAPSGEKHLLLWNPPMVNRELGIRASARSQSTRIARLAIKAGLKALVFAQTRLLVEVITKYLKDVFDHDPRHPPRIRGYRGGYLPTERREVERAMREGRIDGLVGTSALELGVDIGALDVVVLNGYPGSIAATRQRLGRAGRRGQPSLGVLVAGSTALDQYIVRHPEFFEAASPEMARIHADHPLILLDHIRCAAFELPFVEGERFGSVEPAPWLEVLAEAEVLHQESGRWEWIADSYPANAVSLRSVADGNFVVVDRSDGRQQIIAEVDYSAAALTLYEGAIYLLQSQPFQVEKLDWTGRKAYVTRVQVDYYTDAIDYTRLRVLERFDGSNAGVGTCHHGEVHVVRRVSGYKKIRYYTHENIGYGPVNLPDQELHTTALWWSLPAEVLESSFDSRQDALDAFLAAAHALHLVAGLSAMAEARDLQQSVGSGDGSWSRVEGFGRELPEAAEADTRFAPAVFLYDNFPGGIGLSEPLFKRRTELVRAALDLVDACECAAGCPACLGPALQVDEEQGTQAAGPKALAQRVLRLWAERSAHE